MKDEPLALNKTRYKMAGGCVYASLREAHLDQYHPYFMRRGLHYCNSLATLQMHDYASLGVVSMADRVRLFKLVNLIKSSQAEGFACRHGYNHNEQTTTMNENRVQYLSYPSNSTYDHSEQKMSWNENRLQNSSYPNTGQSQGPAKEEPRIVDRKVVHRPPQHNQDRKVTVPVNHKPLGARKTSARTKAMTDESVEFTPGTDSPVFKCRKTLHFSDSEDDTASECGMQPYSASLNKTSQHTSVGGDSNTISSKNHQGTNNMYNFATKDIASALGKLEGIKQDMVSQSGSDNNLDKAIHVINNILSDSGDDLGLLNTVDTTPKSSNAKVISNTDKISLKSNHSVHDHDHMATHLDCTPETAVQLDATIEKRIKERWENIMVNKSEYVDVIKNLNIINEKTSSQTDLAMFQPEFDLKVESTVTREGVGVGATSNLGIYASQFREKENEYSQPKATSVHSGTASILGSQSKPRRVYSHEFYSGSDTNQCHHAATGQHQSRLDASEQQLRSEAVTLMNKHSPNSMKNKKSTIQFDTQSLNAMLVQGTNKAKGGIAMHIVEKNAAKPKKGAFNVMKRMNDHAYFPNTSQPATKKPVKVKTLVHPSRYNYGVPSSPGKSSNTRIASKDNQRIKVCIRKRPLNKKEMARRELDIVKVQGDDVVVVEEAKIAIDLTNYLQEHIFKFDEVFHSQCNNEDVYELTARPLVSHLFRGGRGTCFAFGQTGSGKTHTLLGNSRVAGLYELAGRDICQRLSQLPAANTFFLHASYFEIYCGHLHDLLNKRQRLQVRENAKQQVCIAGLMETKITSPLHLKKVVEYGNQFRRTGSTGVNSTSSRSHAVLQMELRSTSGKRYGRLSFIDLAGSERAADVTEFDRRTRIEGAEINQSLLALKECIRSLDQESSHTPYRQSKLTHILRDSFIGNSRTCMIANVSPSQIACENTLNTLRYADRVKDLHSRTSEGASVRPTVPVQQEETVRPIASLKAGNDEHVDGNENQPDVNQFTSPVAGEDTIRPGLFHPSSIQLSSTPKKSNTHKRGEVMHQQQASGTILQPNESPICGHRFRLKSDNSNTSSLHTSKRSRTRSNASRAESNDRSKSRTSSHESLDSRSRSYERLSKLNSVLSRSRSLSCSRISSASLNKSNRSVVRELNFDDYGQGGEAKSFKLSLDRAAGYLMQVGHRTRHGDVDMDQANQESSSTDVIQHNVILSPRVLHHSSSTSSSSTPDSSSTTASSRPLTSQLLTKQHGYVLSNLDETSDRAWATVGNIFGDTNNDNQHVQPESELQLLTELQRSSERSWSYGQILIKSMSSEDQVSKTQRSTTDKNQLSRMEDNSSDNSDLRQRSEGHLSTCSPDRSSGGALANNSTQDSGISKHTVSQHSALELHARQNVSQKTQYESTSASSHITHERSASSELKLDEQTHVRQLHRANSSNAVTERSQADSLYVHHPVTRSRSQDRMSCHRQESRVPPTDDATEMSPDRSRVAMPAPQDFLRSLAQMRIAQKELKDQLENDFHLKPSSETLSKLGQNFKAADINGRPFQDLLGSPSNVRITSSGVSQNLTNEARSAGSTAHTDNSSNIDPPELKGILKKYSEPQQETWNKEPEGDSGLGPTSCLKHSSSDEDMSDADTLADVPSIRVQLHPHPLASRDKSTDVNNRPSIDQVTEDLHSDNDKGDDLWSFSNIRTQGAASAFSVVSRSEKSSSRSSSGGETPREKHKSPITTEKYGVMEGIFTPIHPVPYRTAVTRSINDFRETRLLKNLKTQPVELESQRLPFQQEISGKLATKDASDEPLQSGKMKAQNQLLTAHEDQLSQITNLCKQEMILLMSVRSGHMSFSEYTKGLQELLSTKAASMDMLQSHLQTLNDQ